MKTPDSPSQATAALPGASTTQLPTRLALVVTAGPDQGARFPLKPGTFYVGKAEGCDLRLNDAAVSRRHLEIALLPEAVEVRDLSSKNGSFYLGARFDVVRLGVGAQVKIGETSLSVVSEGERDEPLYPSDRFGRLLGHGPAMRKVFALLDRLARSDATILLNGETGTGKDLAAHAVHDASPRAARPFVICDLSAIPGTLIESELFGHLRGSFTGADRDRAGAFEQADRGTIFLDEVGELSLELQPRLLRLLESQEVKRVGETHYRTFDVRVVAATNRDLAAEVQAGRFRADLFHRLAVAQVRLPPLRERPDDIAFLTEHFLVDLAAQRGVARLGLPPTTITALCSYSWPGNVRQLRNVIERAVALTAPGAPLTAEVLGIDPAAVDEPPRVVADASIPFKDAKESLIFHWEAEYINQLIDKAGGNIAQAARIAGLDRAHLYRILRKHGLHKPGSE